MRNLFIGSLIFCCSFLTVSIHARTCVSELSGRASYAAEDSLSLVELAQQDLKEVEGIFNYAQLNANDFVGRLRFVTERLDRLGIIYSRTVIWPNMSTSEICLSPEGPARLNRMAKKLLSNYGTKICYDPSQVSFLMTQSKRPLAAYDPRSKKIFLSEIAALLGRPDRGLLHEIKHVALERGATPLSRLFSGAFIHLPFAQYARAKIFSSYRLYFSHDETLTWLFDRVQNRRLAFQLLAQSQIKDSDFDAFTNLFLREYSQADKVLIDQQRLNESLTKDEAALRWVSVSRSGAVRVRRLNWRGVFYSSTIPRPTILSEIGQVDATSNREVRAFFNSGLGRATAYRLDAEIRAQRVAHIKKGIAEGFRENLLLSLNVGVRDIFPEVSSARDQFYRALLSDIFIDRTDLRKVGLGWSKLAIPNRPGFDESGLVEVSAPIGKPCVLESLEGLKWEHFGKFVREFGEDQRSYIQVDVEVEDDSGLHQLKLERGDRTWDGENEFSALYSDPQSRVTRIKLTEYKMPQGLPVPYGFFAIRNRIRLARYFSTLSKNIRR